VARELLLDLLTRNPVDHEAQFLFAQVHQKLGRHEEAIEQFKRLLLIPMHDVSEYEAMNVGIAKSLMAMEQYDKALAILRPIWAQNSVNVTVRLLSARIYAKQGRLAEAFRLVVQNFSIEPDNKASRRFIGEHANNAHQVSMLRAELGDSARSPTILFYVGHMLNEFGSCIAADYFMRDAAKLAPNDPTIFVGTFLNFMALGPSIEEFVEFFVPFGSVLRQFPEFAGLLNNVNFRVLSRDTERPAVRIDGEGPSPESRAECTFEIARFDCIWVVSLAQLFLFLRGYLSVAETIGVNLKPLTQAYDFSQTVIGPEMELQRFIDNLLPIIPRPLTRARAIYVIGDRTSLALAWQSVLVDGENYEFTPLYIRGLHPAALVSKRRTAMQFAYRREFERIEEGALVVLALGTILGHDELMRGYPTEQSYSFLGATEVQFHAITQIAKHLWRTKRCRVWVHPFVSIDTEIKDHFRLLIDLNEQLAFRIWTLNAGIAQIRLIDIIGYMITKDPELSWKPEFSFSEGRIGPTYVQLVETSLNKTERGLAAYQAPRT
jgi:tetratricopeptide (TPR) repeat protein